MKFKSIYRACSVSLKFKLLENFPSATLIPVATV